MNIAISCESVVLKPFYFKMQLLFLTDFYVRIYSEILLLLQKSTNKQCCNQDTSDDDTC